LSLNYWLIVRNTWKKLRRFFILGLIVLVLFGASNLVRNLVLNQVKKKIQSSFGYTRLYLSLFPPALIIENARSVSSSPFFSARKISVKISTRALLSRDKPFIVLIDNPVLRIYETSGKAKTGKKGKFAGAFPFAVERGLIRDGEVFYWGKESRIHSQGANVFFIQRGNTFTLKAEVEKNELDLGKGLPRINGRVKLALEGRGKEIDIKRLTIVGSDGIVKVKGRLYDLLKPEFDLYTSVNLRTPLMAELLKLPFKWEGKAKAEGILSRKEENIVFEGEVSSSSLVLNDVPFGEVTGQLNFWESSGGFVELDIRKRGLPKEYLKIFFEAGKVEGLVRHLHLDSIANFLKLPWPVSSPVWGSFKLINNHLTVNAEFKDELKLKRPGRFPFNGKVNLDWDGKDRVSFFSSDIDSSFSRMNVRGSLTLGRELDITFDGEVKDGKQVRLFTELILKRKFKFPEIRGAGKAKLELFGDYNSPQVKAGFSLITAGFDKLDAEAVEGEIELIRNDFFGRFTVKDPFFNGRIGLFSNPEQTTVNIWVDKGRVETILPAFEIDLPLKGKASGYFEYKERNKKISFYSSFSGDLIDLAGQKLNDVRGKIKGDNKTVSFPELRFKFYQGEVKGNAFLSSETNEFDIDLEGKNIDLSLLYKEMKGLCSLNLSGKGKLGKDLILGKYMVENLHFPPFQPTRAEGDIKLNVKDKTLQLDLKGNFFPGENPFSVLLGIPFGDTPISGSIKGDFNNLNILLPWRGAEGRINYLADISGARFLPQIKGVIDVKGSILPFPRFAHAFRDFSGLVFVENGDFSIRSFQGKFGGGDIKGSGMLKIGSKGLEKIDIRGEGKKLSLALLERTRVLADGKLNLIWDKNRFVLDGDLFINQLSWRRELTEKLSFSSSAYQQMQNKPGFFDGLNLNIHLRADDNAWMENSLGRIRGKFDLTISGNVLNPVLLGEIEALGGSVDFQDRDFKVLEGRISFFNPVAIEPYIRFLGETYIKDYRVTFSLNGLSNKLIPEFGSSPPLPQEDVLALLALGEAFRRTYHYDRSMRQGAASMVSFSLSEEAKKRAEKIFNVDRFRIDPFVLGSTAEVTARLTLGKKLSRNIFILYSTNLSTQREEIMRLEWEISKDLSIVGIRDETGRISLDVKIHKRF
jgi:hypothetical protein